MSDEERRKGRGGAAARSRSSRPGPLKQDVDAELLAEVGLPEVPDSELDPLAAVSRPSVPPPVESQVRRPPRSTKRRSRPPTTPAAEMPDAAARRRSRPSRAYRPAEVVTGLRRPGELVNTAKPPPEPADERFSQPVDVQALSRGVDLPVLGKFGSYDILGRLAMGGMAEILLARKEGSERPVVLKKILAHYARDDEFREMFLDEARIGSVLDHPNICRFLDWGAVDDDQLYIAMEWVHGVTLGRTIRRGREHGGIPPAMACAIVAQVADALHYAHTARDENGELMGLVHRDVSPHNIMLAYDGAVKLLDFGIAKAQVQSHQTQVGVVKGKFAYMAPEQCLGKPLDFRIDIFALGVVLFETLTGKSLYRRGSEAETMRAIVEGPVPSLDEHMDRAPRELEAIVRTALAKEPQHRFPTAAAMRDVLKMYVKRSRQPTGRERVAAMVQHFFAKDLAKGPSVDSTPFGSSYRRDDSPRPTLAPPTRSGEERSTASRAPSSSGELDMGAAQLDTGEPEARDSGVEARDAGVDAFAADELPLPELPLPELDDAAAPLAPAPAPAAAPGLGGLDGILVAAPDLAPEGTSEDAVELAAPVPVLPRASHTPTPPPRPSRSSAPSPPVRSEPLAARGPSLGLKVLVLLLLLGTLVGGVLIALRGEGAGVPPPGRVEIRSVPEGARVLFGDRPPQATPLVFDGVAPGSYDLVIQAPNHRTHRQVLQVPPDRGVVLEVPLEANGP